MWATPDRSPEHARELRFVRLQRGRGVGVMNRRQFVKLTGAGVSVGALAEAVVSAQVAKNPAPAAPATKTSPKARMGGRTQQGDAEGTPRGLAAVGGDNSRGNVPPGTVDVAREGDGLSHRRRRAHGA